MGYDIPQKIKYKEIIAFGLTLKQLFIAMPHIALAGYILLPDYKNILRITLSAIIILSGFGFTLLELDKHLMNLFKFWRFRKPQNKSKELKKYLGVEKLGKNFLELKNKTVLTFLEIEPIDIKLMSDLEKESLSFSFQKFLNSLDFPVQIITTTNTEKVFRKKFFLIIPKKYDLNIQTKLVREKLHESGLKTKILQDYEIIHAFNNFIKNDTKNISINDLKENYAHAILSPEEIILRPDHIIQKEVYSRVINVVGYPRTVNFGFLNKIVQMQEKIDLSIHIEPFSIENLTIKLNSELQKQAADIYSIHRKGGTNPILEIKHSDTRKVLEELQKGEEKLFLVSLYFHCKTNNLNELNKLTEKIKNELNGLLMIPKVELFVQAQALKSCLPLCQNILQEQRNITTKPLSAFFPFTTKFFTQDENGVEFGRNTVNQPIKKDIYKLANHNGVILASSGGGKSYLTKLLVQRYSKLSNQKVFVIDPEGEYFNIIEKLKGQVITIGINSISNINIFDDFGQDLKLKRIKIHEIFYLLFPDLGELQRSYLDKAIQEVYEKHQNDEETPFIGEIYYNLVQKDSEAKDVITKKVLSGLTNRLAMFVTGGFSFMNQQTNIKLDNNIVCFYLKDIPTLIQPALIYLIMDFLYVRMKDDSSKKIVFVDEAWSLLSRTKEDTYLFKLIKTCRKYKMGIFLITQEADDLLSDKTGRALLANSSTTILLRQRSTVIQKLSDVFGLNKEEQMQLLNANVGSGITVFDKERHLIKIVSEKAEHSLIEEEIKEIEKNPFPNLDLNKGYFMQEKLSNDEITYLFNKGFGAIKCHPLIGKSPTIYLVKRRNREGEKHSLIVYQLIEQIKKHAQNVETKEKGNPDISFEFNNENYAIEVETGSNFRGDGKRIIEKIEELKPKYKDKLLFVLLNSDYSYHYKKYCDVFTRKGIQEYLLELFGVEALSPYNAETSNSKNTLKPEEIKENREIQTLKK